MVNQKIFWDKETAVDGTFLHQVGSTLISLFFLKYEMKLQTNYSFSQHLKR